jgi:hypothetical protein
LFGKTRVKVCSPQITQSVKQIYELFQAQKITFLKDRAMLEQLFDKIEECYKEMLMYILALEIVLTKKHTSKTAMCNESYSELKECYNSLSNIKELIPQIFQVLDKRIALLHQNYKIYPILKESEYLLNNPTTNNITQYIKLIKSIVDIINNREQGIYDNDLVESCKLHLRSFPDLPPNERNNIPPNPHPK